MLDVRAIANFVLDFAETANVAVTNMALNKIVYFVHCDYLIEQNEPLVSAKIEAWQHGPVFREIYHEFKRWHDKPIKSRATKVDPVTGEVKIASLTFGTQEKEYLRLLIGRYMQFTAAQLRAISHSEGSPWDVVWGHEGNANPGMKISNEIIKENYSPEVSQ
jgi:uncharacterized phage-associated protein